MPHKLRVLPVPLLLLLLLLMLLLLIPVGAAASSAAAARMRMFACGNGVWANRCARCDGVGIVLGDTLAGKTSLIDRFVGSEFQLKVAPTLGAITNARQAPPSHHPPLPLSHHTHHTHTRKAATAIHPEHSAQTSARQPS